MASLLMHLYVGKKFAEKHEQIINLSQFYLGCIISDSVNMENLSPKDIRWAAHIRSSNIKEWYDNNIEYYRRTVGSVDYDLLLGYVIHNITDAAFDEFFSDSIRDGLLKMGKQPIKGYSLRWEDCFRFEYDQRKKSWWTNDILPALKKAVPAEINGIDKSNVEMLINNITDEKWFDFPEGNSVMVTIKMMDELTDIVCEIVDKFINM